MVTEVKPLPKKALRPTDATELGMVMEVKPLQNAKAASPMDVTELGMVMEIKLLKLAKAARLIDVIPLSITTEVIELRYSNHGSNSMSFVAGIAPVPLMISVPLSIIFHVKLPMEPLGMDSSLSHEIRANVAHNAKIIKRDTFFNRLNLFISA